MALAVSTTRATGLVARNQCDWVLFVELLPVFEDCVTGGNAEIGATNFVTLTLTPPAVAHSPAAGGVTRAVVPVLLCQLFWLIS